MSGCVFERFPLFFLCSSSMEELVEALVNGDRKVQTKAAIEISEVKGTQKRKMLIDVDIIIHGLVLMLKSQDYEAIEASLLALISVSSGSDRYTYIYIYIHIHV